MTFTSGKSDKHSKLNPVRNRIIHYSSNLKSISKDRIAGGKERQAGETRDRKMERTNGWAGGYISVPSNPRNAESSKEIPSFSSRAILRIFPSFFVSTCFSRHLVAPRLPLPPDFPRHWNSEFPDYSRALCRGATFSSEASSRAFQ